MKGASEKIDIFSARFFIQHRGIWYTTRDTEVLIRNEVPYMTWHPVTGIPVWEAVSDHD